MSRARVSPYWYFIVTMSVYLIPFLRYSASNNSVTFKSGLGSFKVIENGTIRKPGNGFQFAFYSNYSHILCHFRDKARYWSKTAMFSYPYCIRRLLGGSNRKIATTFSVDKKLSCRRETARRFVSLNILLSLKVTQSHSK